MMQLVATLSRYFRQRRMRWFLSTMGVTSATRILDVGGSPETWQGLSLRPCVILVNIPMSITETPSALPWVAADGCWLPFQDKAFDIVFSNSVIEHVGDVGHQQAFARETRRVGKRYFVQTPNRGFPVEQHLFVPIVHWLPKPWQQRIIHRFTVWELLARPRPDQRAFYLAHYLQDIRLLDPRGMLQLFPDGHLQQERVLGMTKSLIAIGPKLSGDTTTDQ